jgi:hypothetical protein
VAPSLSLCPYGVVRAVALQPGYVAGAAAAAATAPPAGSTPLRLEELTAALGGDIGGSLTGLPVRGPGRGGWRLAVGATRPPSAHAV